MNIVERSVETSGGEQGKAGGSPGDGEWTVAVPPVEPEADLLPIGGELRSRPARASARQISYTRTASFAPPADVQRDQRLVMAADAGTMAAYKLLRTQVLQRLKAKGWRALAVTSPGPGEGKTLTAVNLALILAQDVNQTVLLVDLDLRHPRVHRAFGYEPAAGITDHLFAGVPLPDILFTPGVERLVVLPGREAYPHSSEILASPDMIALVQELKDRYPDRLVLFDLPPLLSADDALAFAPYVDAAILVVREGVTTQESFERALRYLGHTPIVGTVLNATPERLDGY